MYFQTYGESSQASYIELKRQCLYYETNMTVKRIKEVAVDVKISKSSGERTGRRRTITTVVVSIVLSDVVAHEIEFVYNIIL